MHSINLYVKRMQKGETRVTVEVSVHLDKQLFSQMMRLHQVAKGFEG